MSVVIEEEELCSPESGSCEAGFWPSVSSDESSSSDGIGVRLRGIAELATTSNHHLHRLQKRRQREKDKAQRQRERRKRREDTKFATRAQTERERVAFESFESKMHSRKLSKRQAAVDQRMSELNEIREYHARTTKLRAEEEQRIIAMEKDPERLKRIADEKRMSSHERLKAKHEREAEEKELLAGIGLKQEQAVHAARYFRRGDSMAVEAGSLENRFLDTYISAPTAKATR